MSSQKTYLSCKNGSQIKSKSASVELMYYASKMDEVKNSP